MKQIRKALIAYTVIMIAGILVLAAKVRNYSFNMGNVDAYSDEELKIYKTIRDNISTSLDSGRAEALKLV